MEDVKRMEKAGGPELNGGKTLLQFSLTNSRQSFVKKYQDLVVGRPGLAGLLKYELMTCFLGPLPGALGLVARKKLYGWLLGRMGEGCVVGKSVTLRHPGKIRLGSKVIIDDYAVLDAKGETNRGIDIADHVMVGRNTVISCKNGDIVIGENANIAMNCFIQSARSVEIGKNVLISAYCYVIGGGDHLMDRIDVPILAQGQVVKGIRIGDNCLIGAGVMIRDGVTIGHDAIVGAGAVVLEDVPDFGVAVGVPAKVVRKRNENRGG